MRQYIAAESVCAGHPDKICDQISDAIVDEALRQDSQARVAVETLVTTNRVVLAGEVSLNGAIDYEDVARNTIRDLGYEDAAAGFTWKSPIEVHIHQQSQDIALGVDNGGAGDQGIMFGYACRETPELMPLPITLSNRLAQALDGAKKRLTYLRPDGKVEVVVKYDEGRPSGVEQVVLAVPHDLAISSAEVKRVLIGKVVEPVFSRYGLDMPGEKKIVLNGTGRWEWGGPAADTGVTGRKIVADSYGGAARVGGGAFSGKDPTKVDRSAAYAARFVAKNLVSVGFADRCEVQVAYIIGKVKPIALNIETYGTNHISLGKINTIVRDLLDFSLPSIFSRLDLCQPIYKKAAAYGHFGRAGFPWEEVVM